MNNDLKNDIKLVRQRLKEKYPDDKGLNNITAGDIKFILSLYFNNVYYLLKRNYIVPIGKYFMLVFYDRN